MGAVPVTLVVVLVAVIIAAVTDLRWFTIHNALTLPLLASGLIYHAFVNDGVGLFSSIGGALFGAGILGLIYLLGGMGAGDVKLMAGIGAWLGWPLILQVFVITTIAGAIYGLALIAAFGRGDKRSSERIIEAAVRRDDRRRRLVPYGAMMMVGVVVTTARLWTGDGFLNAYP